MGSPHSQRNSRQTRDVANRVANFVANRAKSHNPRFQIFIFWNLGNGGQDHLGWIALVALPRKQFWVSPELFVFRLFITKNARAFMTQPAYVFVTIPVRS